MTAVSGRPDRDTHTQCMLRRDQTVMTAWIPSKCAIVGKTVDLDDPEHGETKGWTVETVGTTMATSYVRERSRDHLTQREGSDI